MGLPQLATQAGKPQFRIEKDRKEVMVNAKDREFRAAQTPLT